MAPFETSLPDESHALDAALAAPRLLCARCRYVLAGEARPVAVDGSHEHTFANPHGLVFTVRCFEDGEGVRGEGDPSTLWSWFPGFSWQIGRCRGCAAHLGWRFTPVRAGGPAGAFLGLVHDRVVEG